MDLSPVQTEDMTIAFTDVMALYKTLDELHGHDFVIVNNISRNDFGQIDKEREVRRRKFCFFYQASKLLLCVTLPSEPHEVAHLILYEAIRENMITHPKMPLWRPCGATTFTHPDGLSSKEAGSGGSPGHGHTTGSDQRWPALVMECGMTQSMASLHTAMEWWFSASEHRVKVVLIVKLYKSMRTIIIEKWTDENVGFSRPGATTTRSSSMVPTLQPVLQQTITTSPVPNSGPHSGALVLELELLYRRAPGPNPGERDFVVPEAVWEQLAVVLWY